MASGLMAKRSFADKREERIEKRNGANAMHLLKMENDFLFRRGGCLHPPVNATITKYKGALYGERD